MPSNLIRLILKNIPKSIIKLSDHTTIENISFVKLSIIEMYENHKTDELKESWNIFFNISLHLFSLEEIIAA